ncbi:hypothetical protein KKI24_14325 [bacterium]|nr:hypothetical protein [bacterium]
MELFDRYWTLAVRKYGAFRDLIKLSPDDFGNSLRITFEINCATDLRFYTGTINVYNLSPDNFKGLTFNALNDELGTGPSIRLEAGYREKTGIIFDGAIHRGYPVREPLTGTWIMALQCGLPLKTDKSVKIDPQKVTNATLYSFLNSVVNKLTTQPDRWPVKKAPGYDAAFLAAVTEYTSSHTVNKSIGYNGPMSMILAQITEEFNLHFVYGHSGLIVVSGKYGTSDDPVRVPDGLLTPEISFSKKSGLIGSPTYTDTGAKFLVYLRPELRMFQWVRVISSVLDRNVAVNGLIHRGDSRGDDWFSEIDGVNKNLFLKAS